MAKLAKHLTLFALVQKLISAGLSVSYSIVQLVLVIPVVDNQIDLPKYGNLRLVKRCWFWSDWRLWQVSGGGDDALELHGGEHSEVEDLDEGEFSLVLSRLNLNLFCLEWRGVGTLVTLFCVKRVLSVVLSVRKNLLCGTCFRVARGEDIRVVIYNHSSVGSHSVCRVSIRSVIQILHLRYKKISCIGCGHPDD